MTRATFTAALTAALLSAASLYLTYATYAEQRYANGVIATLRDTNLKLTRDLKLTEDALDKQAFENVELRDRLHLIEIERAMAAAAKEAKRL